MKFCRALSVLLLIPLLLSASIAGMAEVSAIKEIALAAENVVIEPGDSVRIVSGAKFDSWESSNSSVASVKDGVVTGEKNGVATITAKAGRVSIKTLVRVVRRIIRVKTISLDQTLVTLDKGNSVQLNATVSPYNADNAGKISWSSDNAAVATVENGKVVAVGSGVAKITAKVEKKTASCTVRVRGTGLDFTITAAGDVILGGDPRPRGTQQIVSEERFEQLVGSDMSYPFRQVRQYFDGEMNVSFVNLECALTRVKSFTRKPNVLHGKTDYIQMLKYAGIDVVSMGNNHANDYGTKGYRETKQALLAGGIQPAGFHENAYLTLNQNGVSVKIGFCAIMGPVGTGEVRRKIRTMKKRCDVAVLSYHNCGTVEWASKVFDSDRRVARAAIDAGADLVLGHHRHVVSGIEEYKGKMIVYDLSNFVVGIKHKSDNDSMIYQQKIRWDEGGFAELKGFTVIPCTTTTSSETYPAEDNYGNLGAKMNVWQPAPLSGSEAQRVKSRIEAMSNVKIQ